MSKPMRITFLFVVTALVVKLQTVGDSAHNFFWLTILNAAWFAEQNLEISLREQRVKE